MVTNPAPSITRTASKQTYYTIRFLVDRELIDDAYRAYAYFRWVDDVLDGDDGPAAGSIPLSAGERIDFLTRQKGLLENCYQGVPLGEVNPQEQMLVDLVQHDPSRNSGLRTYLQNMMQVMDFDVLRRGRLITQVELDQYTYWLASAVTEAMHYFIGHCCSTPHDWTRYLAVTAAHITHMLRDTIDDVHAGYYNIPREVLEANHMGPEDIYTDAYRAWVKKRVEMARNHFNTGKAYLARVDNLRCRLAGFAYAARFEWLLETLDQEDYHVRLQYDERRSIGMGLRMSWQALSSMIQFREMKPASRRSE